MTKVEKLKNGLSIKCKYHGEHTNWRIHTGNNVQCRKCASEHQKKAREKDPVKFLVRDAKQHAKVKNREFTIDIDDVLDCLYRQNNKCALSGVSFSSTNRPSLDRIDSNLGYTKDNIQLLLKEVNIMKSNLPQDRFLSLCGLIALSKAKMPKPKMMKKAGRGR